MNSLNGLGVAAKSAASVLATASSEQKNKLLNMAADALQVMESEILAANEKDIQNALNNIVSGLNIDNDGDKIDAKVVISGIKQIANSVSKATKFYFNED